MSTVEIPQETRRSFFTVGGTLPANAPSYVERKADTDLFAHLMDGQFCYVLTSRQVGKSSLMVRTAIRLRQADRRVAVLDLTKVGMNLSAEQWYDGLLVQLGREFDLEDQLDDFWTSTQSAVQRMGPMQRWMTALRQVILPSLSGNIVIFLDEIDAVRGLPFATDEFFAGIRQVYNNRTADPELNRLTFCLIGVATPADLIRNVSTTPFNIGNRVVLTDFTEQEAEPLIDGLGREPIMGFRLLRRILWWTNGHPYITQRLCAAVAADPKVTTPKDVDRVCGDLFLSARARESDDNLLFVRERILRKRGEAELSGLLDLYGLIHRGKQVAADDNNPLIDILRLAGLVAVRDNRLVVRNRIYNHVFDERWIRMNMPDAELRRQREAYRKGVLRTVGLAVVVLFVIAGLALWNQYQEQVVAFQNYSAHVIQVQQAFDSGDYAAGVEGLRETQPMVRTEPHWLERQIDRSRYLTGHLVPFILRHPVLYALFNDFDQKVDARFEWNYLRARLFGDGAFFYRGNRDEIRSVAVSPHNATWLATGSADSTVRIFDISVVGAAAADPPQLKCALAVFGDQATRKGQPSYKYILGGSGQNWSVNQQLDRDLSALNLIAPTAMVPGARGQMFTAQSLNARNSSRLPRPLWNPPGIMSVAFSPDGAWIAVGSGNWDTPQTPGTVYLWSTASLCSGSAQVLQIPAQDVTSAQGTVLTRVPHEAVDTVVFRNGQELASTGEDNTAEFWRILPGGRLQQEGAIDASATTTKGMNAAAFSPDGSTFAMGFGDGHFCTTAISADGHPPKGACDHPQVADVSGLMSMAWYPKGNNNLILLGTRDGRVIRADRQGDAWKFSTFLETGQGLVTSLTFSNDGKLLLTTGSDGTVLVWKMVPDEHNGDLLGYSDNEALRGAKSVVYSAAVTPDQRLIVSGGADSIDGNVDGRAYFWIRQPRPDGALKPKGGLPTGAADPLVKVACEGMQVTVGIEPTWSSQPPFQRTCGAVQALAYSPAGLPGGGGEIAGIVGVSRPQDALGREASRIKPSASIFIQRLAISSADSREIADNTAKKRPDLMRDPVTQMQLYPERPINDPFVLAGKQTNGVAVAWSADGKLLAAAENDRAGYCGTVQLWDVTDWRTAAKTPVALSLSMPAPFASDCDSPSKGNDAVRDLAFLPSGVLIAGVNHTDSKGSRSMLILWNAARPGDNPTVIFMSDMRYRDDGRVRRPYSGDFTLAKLAFTTDVQVPEGRQWMAVCGSQNSIQVWNLPSALWNRGASANQNARTLAQLTSQSLKLERNLTGDEYASSSDSPGGLQGQCSAIAFSPDSRWIAAGTQSYEIAAWSTPRHFAPNWRRVEGEKITASLVETGEEKSSSAAPYYVPSPPMANAAIYTIVFSPDNRRLAYGTADGKINLWHMIAQTPLPIINVHSGGVLALAFSPNGVCLASGSSDQTMRLSCEVDPAVLDLQGIEQRSEQPQKAGGQPDWRPEDKNWIPFAQ